MLILMEQCGTITIKDNCGQTKFCIVVQLDIIHTKILQAKRCTYDGC